MRPKSLLLLTLALGCGLVASIGISQVLDRKSKSGPAPKTEAIYIAKVDINLGDALTEELLNLEEWPADKVPSGVIRTFDELAGRRPRTKIYKGEPILEAKLIAADARDHPAQQVPPGYRIVSVRVSVETGGAGLLRPGDRVDVQLFTKRDPRRGIAETQTRTILKEIRVFAVDQDFRASEQDEASPARTISLVVTPDQGDKLMLATRLGDINLTIRNPDDTLNVESAGANIQDLLLSSTGNPDKERGGSKEPSGRGTGFLSFMEAVRSAASKSAAMLAAAPVATAPGPWTMLVLEGSEVRQVQVDRNGYFPNGPGDPLLPDFSLPTRTALPPAAAERADRERQSAADSAPTDASSWTPAETGEEQADEPSEPSTETDWNGDD